jgi:hypothetical protein
MNRIVEKVNYSDGSYWGEPGKMKFRTSIDSFTNATEIEGERLIKTTFSMTLNGYILPESYNNYNTTQKYLSPKKLIVRESTDTTLVDDTGKRVGLSSNAVEFGEETKDIFSINISNGLLFEQGTGVTLSNNGFSFDGSDNLTQEFSIGQSVGTTDNVQFNTLTANSVQIGEGTTVITDGNISSSDGTIEITGSTAITGSMTVVGDLNVTGSLISQVFITEVTTQSIDFSQGSNEFGNSLDDSQEFTGSVDITGSFSLNGYEITGISNDPTFTNASQTSLVTEYALANFNIVGISTNETDYLRKNFYKKSNSIIGTNTASFSATTASAPTSLTSTSENDFVFFINGQYMEHDAVSIQQSDGGTFLLKVNTDSIGYDLESDDEILAIGKFDS